MNHYLKIDPKSRVTEDVRLRYQTEGFRTYMEALRKIDELVKTGKNVNREFIDIEFRR